MNTTQPYLKLPPSYNYMERRSLIRICLKRCILLSMPLICSYNNNIENVILPNIELITCLLVVEQNNELLFKNHHSHPTGSMSLPEVYATSVSNHKHGLGHGIIMVEVEAKVVVVAMVVIILGIR